MIEERIRNHLQSALTVPVYFKRPASPPESYVVLTKTGDSLDNWLMQSTFAVQSIAPSLFETVVLDAEVRAALVCWQDAYVSAVQYVSGGDWTDTTTKTIRYQSTYVITHTMEA